jgi:hypothetical protein
VNNRVHCPNCDTFTVARWQEQAYRSNNDIDRLFVYQTNCLNCGEPIIYVVRWRVARDGKGDELRQGLQEQLVWPLGQNINKSPANAPSNIAKDYEEAQLVLPSSVNASAALARRCLQNLIRNEFGVVRGDLKSEIEAFLEKKDLPKRLREDIRAIRPGGNVGVHAAPDENEKTALEVEDASVITDVTFEEAEFLLNTLRSLFEELYVLEPESEKHRESLKQKDKEQQTRVREETKKNGKSDAPLL